MPSINRHIKIFVLLSLLCSLVAIDYLFYNGNTFQDEPRFDLLQMEQASTAPPDERFNGECFKARTDTVLTSQYGKLTPPYINLGFPKMGTSSIHSFFACAGYRAMHYRCVRYERPDVKCSECIQQSVEAGLPPFEKCSVADVYSQLDDGSNGHFPQVEYLDEIVRGTPHGTFFLTFRSMEKWYHSITHWPPQNEFGPYMSDGLRDANITGFSSGHGRNLEEFSSWFCRHVQRVRDIVAQNPSQTLVEIDIEDPTISSYMADVFDIDESCWGRQNVNTKLHPEHNVNQSKQETPWFVQGKRCIKGKTGMRNKPMKPLPHIPGLPASLFMLNDTKDCK